MATFPTPGGDLDTWGTELNQVLQETVFNADGTLKQAAVANDGHSHTGSTISNLAAADTTTGVFAAARLGTGTPDATKFLRGDLVWEVPSAAPPATAVMRLMKTQHFR